MKVEGVIFDLDGTLLDSTWVWTQIDIDFLGKYGFDVPDDYPTEIMSMGFEDVAVYTIERFGIKATKEEVMAEWNSMACEAYAHKVELKPGTKELLEWLKEKEIPTGVATSNSEALFKPCLKNRGIYDLFRTFTETGDVERGKEFPDVYIEAAKKMGVSPKNCLVVEDIIPALSGARNGGFTTVGIREKRWNYSTEELQKFCDYVVSEISEIHEVISLINRLK